MSLRVTCTASENKFSSGKDKAKSKSKVQINVVEAGKRFIKVTGSAQAHLFIISFNISQRKDVRCHQITFKKER